ncbi:hypothetical protein [Methylobacterium aquaticum]|uniref:hypothetical protein n=1 Tax=Methylobacterium aquaticum TaxID=270351 RepID=UPI0019313F37|nr:hypothetical protein [Methylobacterium aquaticum]QRE76503.1 hypothetical protein F1D61_25640 [Methylobacterium aquaticum]
MIALSLLLGASAVALAHLEMGSIARTGSAESTMAWVVIGHLMWMAGSAGALVLAGFAFLRGRS